VTDDGAGAWAAHPRRFPYDPYRLLAVHGGLYCVGKVPAYTNFVTLAVDRIRSLELLEESFTVARRGA
jgi:hypothetical protein